VQKRKPWRRGGAFRVEGLGFRVWGLRLTDQAFSLECIPLPRAAGDRWADDGSMGSIRSIYTFRKVRTIGGCLEGLLLAGIAVSADLSTSRRVVDGHHHLPRRPGRHSANAVL
jgi:hypothetical protein